jgi:ribonuclease Z
MMDCYGIPASQVGNIKNGADWTTADGEVIPNSRLVVPADKPRSYAYISDTRYMSHLHEQLMEVDTLYHESTYGDDHLPQSEKYYHSTARQAAKVALDAKVGKLLIGHYSSRYEDERVLLNEAKEVFENTFLTNEMDVFDV